MASKPSVVYSPVVDKIIYSPWSRDFEDDDITNEDWLILAYASLCQAGANPKGHRSIDYALNALTANTDVLALITDHHKVAEYS